MGEKKIASNSQNGFLEVPIIESQNCRVRYYLARFCHAKGILLQRSPSDKGVPPKGMPCGMGPLALEHPLGKRKTLCYSKSVAMVNLTLLLFFVRPLYLSFRGNLNNSKLFSVSLVYFAWQGSRYTPVTGSAFRQNLNNYQPAFDQNLYGRQYNPYNRLDLSFSKFILFKPGNLLLYFNVNNILNRKNQRQITYNQDYTAHSFDFYMLRTLYFGAVRNFE